MNMKRPAAEKTRIPGPAWIPGRDSGLLFSDPGNAAGSYERQSEPVNEEDRNGQNDARKNDYR